MKEQDVMECDMWAVRRNADDAILCMFDRESEAWRYLLDTGLEYNYSVEAVNVEVTEV